MAGSMTELNNLFKFVAMLNDTLKTDHDIFSGTTWTNTSQQCSGIHFLSRWNVGHSGRT